jgi:hypothetical protein
MDSFIARKLALTNPDKVDSLILYATSRGDKEHEPSPEVIQTFSNTSITPKVIML